MADSSESQLELSMWDLRALDLKKLYYKRNSNSNIQIYCQTYIWKTKNYISIKSLFSYLYFQITNQNLQCDPFIGFVILHAKVSITGPTPLSAWVVYFWTSPNFNSSMYIFSKLQSPKMPQPIILYIYCISYSSALSVAPNLRQIHLWILNSPLCHFVLSTLSPKQNPPSFFYLFSFLTITLDSIQSHLLLFCVLNKKFVSMLRVSLQITSLAT